MVQVQNSTETLSKTHRTYNFEIVETTFQRLLEEQLKLREKAQRRKDAQQAHIHEICSISNSLYAEIESVIASTKGPDQGIACTQETIAKAHAQLEMTLKACELTMKTITELSRQRDDRNKALLANQAELEALESDPSNNVSSARKNCTGRLPSKHMKLFSQR